MPSFMRALKQHIVETRSSRNRYRIGLRLLSPPARGKLIKLPIMPTKRFQINELTVVEKTNE